ncbi:Late embryogenesis abundant protein, LEA-14 [Spatholobus suberectus]|nr:Late embryogenesis abundant protein, LEA-14 [Spatholobus suberectus]
MKPNDNMSMLAKTDSEVSSLSQSSPARSPRRAVYYVQSPSRDSSHDGEKTTNSFHSSPLQSPLGSPPHSHSNSSLGRHSRESASTRFSGSRKSSSANRKGPWRPWKDQFHAIEEEGLLDAHDNAQHGFPRRCYFLAFVVGFTVLFSVFSLILWGASRPQKPAISLKSITFDQFVIQAGADASGVATSLVSMNSSVKLTFRNTATFFGVHVTSTPLDLNYYQLTLATGTMPKFYQSRKSQRSVRVMVKGSHIPLYGGGANLNSVNGAPADPVPLTLSVMVRSRAYVLGKLVKPKFYRKIECSVVVDPKKMGVAISLVKKCTYQ